MLVNSAHVAFILTPFWFGYSSLQLSEPLPEALLNLAGSQAGRQAVKALPAESKGPACEGSGVRFLGERIPSTEGCPSIPLVRSTARPVMKRPNGWQCSKSLHEPYFWPLFRFLVGFAVSVFKVKS